jgi:hypothetical protein
VELGYACIVTTVLEYSTCVNLPTADTHAQCIHAPRLPCRAQPIATATQRCCCRAARIQRRIIIYWVSGLETHPGLILCLTHFTFQNQIQAPPALALALCSHLLRILRAAVSDPLGYARPCNRAGLRSSSMVSICADDCVANETMPVPGIKFDATGTSRNLVREKRQNFEHADSGLVDYIPEKLSGEGNLKPHVKPGHQLPVENSTTKRGNLEINSRDTAEHRRSTTISRKPSHANEPHVKPRRNQQSDSDIDGNKRTAVGVLQRSTKSQAVRGG